MTVSQRKQYSHVFIILAAGLLLFVIIKPWNLYFLNDDFEHIPAAGEHLFINKFFLRPFPNLFLLSDKFFFNTWAPGYFFTTWLLHLACAVASYYVSFEVIKKYAPALHIHTALLTALFFLYYPFHAEPLFWIIGRGAIIAALFTILSIYFYLRKNEKAAHLFLSLLFFIVALLSYESIWNALFFYFLISFINTKQGIAAGKREFFHAGLFLLAFIAYFIVRYFSLHTLTGGYEEIDNNITKIPLLFTNLAKLVARNFTPPFQSTTFSIIFLSLSVIVYSAATILTYRKSKSAYWLVIILWLGLGSGVITATPLGIDTHGNESERYIYYSSFFFCFFLAIVTNLPEKKAWQYMVTGFIIAAGITGLIIYNNNYKYASTVTKTTLAFVQKYPDYKNAYFIDVPGEYKGALIFRVCLPDAIKWIAKKCKYDSVIIISKKEDASGEVPYGTGEKTWAELSREKGLEAQPPVYVLSDSLKRKINLNKNDIVFWFTGKGVFKVNRP